MGEELPVSDGLKFNGQGTASYITLFLIKCIDKYQRRKHGY
jgi:hypothetical protein